MPKLNEFQHIGTQKGDSSQNIWIDNLTAFKSSGDKVTMTVLIKTQIPRLKLQTLEYTP